VEQRKGADESSLGAFLSHQNPQYGSEEDRSTALSSGTMRAKHVTKAIYDEQPADMASLILLVCPSRKCACVSRNARSAATASANTDSDTDDGICATN
jgi:hypothetical protein